MRERSVSPYIKDLGIKEKLNVSALNKVLEPTASKFKEKEARIKS